jgi:superfamily II helicase
MNVSSEFYKEMQMLINEFFNDKSINNECIYKDYFMDDIIECYMYNSSEHHIQLRREKVESIISKLFKKTYKVGIYRFSYGI